MLQNCWSIQAEHTREQPDLGQALPSKTPRTGVSGSGAKTHRFSDLRLFTIHLPWKTYDFYQQKPKVATAPTPMAGLGQDLLQPHLLQRSPAAPVPFPPRPPAPHPTVLAATASSCPSDVTPGTTPISRPQKPCKPWPIPCAFLLACSPEALQQPCTCKAFLSCGLERKKQYAHRGKEPASLVHGLRGKVALPNYCSKGFQLPDSLISVLINCWGSFGKIFTLACF